MCPAENAARTDRVRALFDLVAETYDSVAVPWFGPIAGALVSCLAPRPGERALDLGTGRGAALWPLAAGVAPGGHVTGLDLSPRMVEETRRTVAARGLAGVELLVGDASAPALPEGRYDLAVASLVLFFLPDPGAALRAWRQLLVPGGRVGISTFAGRDRRWSELDDVFTPYLPPELLDARTSGSRGAFASDEGVAALLVDSGFVEVQTMSHDLHVRFTGVEQWREWTWSHGQRSHWLAVPEDRRPAVLEQVASRVEPFADGSGAFTLRQTVRCTTARRRRAG
ncbi:class I SAM-dependent methyltransferase [Actinotalea sp.]|uniref:class I SAM-dependent methyltransferase n=1 Tax=Actinotalea sp. TaxID=1872145 RepID=UPI003562127B